MQPAGEFAHLDSIQWQVEFLVGGTCAITARASDPRDRQWVDETGECGIKRRTRPYRGNRTFCGPSDERRRDQPAFAKKSRRVIRNRIALTNTQTRIGQQKHRQANSGEANRGAR